MAGKRRPQPSVGQPGGDLNAGSGDLSVRSGDKGDKEAGVRVGVIRKRRDFLALRHGKKAHAPGFLMAARRNARNGPDEARLGLTVTKKLGGAVVRNRIRRRLRAAAREVFPGAAAPGVDYVLIARPPALERDYRALLDDLERALLRLGPILK